MHTKLIVLFALFSVSWSRDITIGSTDKGRKIFDETRGASPAIWRQIENVTIIAPSDELISGVVVTDMRPDKDGDAEVVDGGEGKKSVTVELKSPTVLRGYEFHIEIFTVPETMYTDAEEHLSSSDEVNVTPQNKKTTELTQSSTAKDVQTLVGEEMNSDNIRPARETVDNTTPITELPEDITTTNTYETTASEDKINSDLSLDIEKTTELSESEMAKVVPAVAATDLNSDSLRPARETNLQASDASNSAVTGDDTTTTESNTNDEITTESGSTTLSDDVITIAPITFDNSKNIPDYPSLSILDYIKSKEGTRYMRHTEDSSNIETNPTHTTPSTASEEPSTTPKNDDTVDLVPPEIDASYNNDFNIHSELTTTSKDTSASLMDKSRSGRGLNVDSVTDSEQDSTPIPSTTEFVTLSNEDNTTDVASVDYEQARNTRDARKDVEDFSNGEDTPKEVPENTAVPVTGQGNTRNVIVISRDLLTKYTGDQKVQYALPIVLIIGSENNFPVIKIIAEDSSAEAENNFVLYTRQPTEESEEENVSIESDKTDNMYTTSGDY